MHVSQDDALRHAVARPDLAVRIIGEPDGARRCAPVSDGGDGAEAVLPGLSASNLGGGAMNAAHGLRYPYICGEMANGIATTKMVEAIAEHGMLGFFGAAGLSIERIEKSVVDLASRCGKRAWGSNLIHSPAEPEIEEKTVDIYLRHGVTRVSASAFMNLRPSAVRYACHGLRLGSDGTIVRRNHLFAKVSRTEVARHFLSPAPAAMLDSLVEKKAITREEANLAQRLPVASHVTVEADSGGHTDNGALVVLLPAILALAEELRGRFGWKTAPLVGAAGGIGVPGAVAAAFAMGAAYVLTGSVNQCTRESGQSEAAKRLLAQAAPADVMMAPAGDMFEQGVRVQVLKRGTMFPVRAAKLFDLYRRYETLDHLPPDAIATLEKDHFRKPVSAVWRETREYFAQRRPQEITRAESEPRHKMALVFRWYLGASSRWPLEGDAARQIDYQIWCGPAMGAFNQWVAGSFLEEVSNRTVAEIALNLMHGAASITRAHQIASFGVPAPAALFTFRPRPFTSPAGAKTETFGEYAVAG